MSNAACNQGEAAVRPHSPDAATVPDLAAIRARADEVLEAMDMDPGPITAEPYAGWAQREALDALALVDYIEAA